MEAPCDRHTVSVTHWPRPHQRREQWCGPHREQWRGPHREQWRGPHREHSGTPAHRRLTSADNGRRVFTDMDNSIKSLSMWIKYISCDWLVGTSTRSWLDRLLPVSHMDALHVSLTLRCETCGASHLGWGAVETSSQGAASVSGTPTQRSERGIFSPPGEIRDELILFLRGPSAMHILLWFRLAAGEGAMNLSLSQKWIPPPPSPSLPSPSLSPSRLFRFTSVASPHVSVSSDLFLSLITIPSTLQRCISWHNGFSLTLTSPSRSVPTPTRLNASRVLLVPQHCKPIGTAAPQWREVFRTRGRLLIVIQLLFLEPASPSVLEAPPPHVDWRLSSWWSDS